MQTICKILDELQPKADAKSYLEQISYVTDRAGHDFRYAMDPSKIQNDLGWQAEENFDTGIRKTVQWYLDNQEWVNHILSGEYQSWIQQNYSSR